MLFTSTYSDNSLALTFFSSLMMLHVTLIRLQGSRKLHFSFQIATLSARGGDQKEKKKKKNHKSHVRAHSWAWQESCPSKRPGKRSWGRGEETHVHACLQDVTQDTGMWNLCFLSQVYNSIIILCGCNHNKFIIINNYKHDSRSYLVRRRKGCNSKILIVIHDD